MSRRVRFAATIAVAVLGIVAFREPVAAGQPPAAMKASSCARVAVVTYDPDNAQFPLTVDAKPLEVTYPARDASKWAVCWYLVVQGDDPDPFQQMKLEDVDAVKGQNGQSVLKGDQSFQGKGFVKVFFNDEPKWSAGSDPHATIPYKVVGRLKGATTDLAVDPDIIIRH